jgi:TatD DNase family protein
VIDSHCHVAGEEFEADLPAVIGRAKAAGLTGALVILAADDETEYQRANAVTEAWDGIRLSIGVHPHAAAQFADEPARAARLVEERIAGRSAARALGEIGLDYHYDFAPRDVQQAVFREQIRTARRLSLPLIIHTREAEEDTFRLLAEESAGDAGVVLHCFTGNRAMATRALDLGWFLSLAGIVTFPRANELHEVAKMVPLDRLLIETDSPFLAPVPHRGSRNEPARVVHIAEAVGQLRGIPSQAVADATRDTFVRLFKP